MDKTKENELSINSQTSTTYTKESKILAKFSESRNGLGLVLLHTYLVTWGVLCSRIFWTETTTKAELRYCHIDVLLLLFTWRKINSNKIESIRCWLLYFPIMDLMQIIIGVIKLCSGTARLETYNLRKNKIRWCRSNFNEKILIMGSTAKQICWS